MAYITNLSTGQHLYIDNQGSQTSITLSTSSPGQQQSQQQSITTGTWTAPPTLFQDATGLTLRIEAATKQTFIRIQGAQIQILSHPPVLTQADILPLQFVESSVPTSSSSLPPLQPMTMGDMTMGSMQMQPMQMRMGNMEMQMGSQSSTSSDRRFCSQCGQAVQVGDRFCAHCGNSLRS
jgi:hypothetical protein